VSQHNPIRQAFVAFHRIVGIALLWASIHTMFHLGPGDLHARIIGTIEARGGGRVAAP
jgi:hypothetical protein